MSKVVAIVDPLSTGAHMALDAKERGFDVIAVWSETVRPENKRILPGMHYIDEVDQRASIAETAKAVFSAASGKPIVACMVGAEDGVTLADELSLEMGLRTNGKFAPGPRRNKNIQQKIVKAAGLHSIREGLGSSWEEVADFVDQESLPIVVKPVESSGSDGVKLCRTKEEVKEHFESLLASQRRIGSSKCAVLCQEFLQGTEYAVDHVSRDGVHKTIVVWVYDKRPANGAAFVYFGTIPVDPSTEVAKTLINYARNVLDAMDFKNGPSHGEIMMTETGPCLVEMNCRCSGGDGSLSHVARAITGGYAQPDVALHAYIDEASWEGIPSLPPHPFKSVGQQVPLVSFCSGTVRSMPGFDKFKKMQSFKHLLSGVKVGSKVDLTVDTFTSPGFVIVAHTDPEIVEADIAEIRRIEREALIFTFDEDVDPAQCYPSVDTVVPDGRRRSSTNFDDNELQIDAHISAKPWKWGAVSPLALFPLGLILSMAWTRSR